LKSGSAVSRRIEIGRNNHVHRSRGRCFITMAHYLPRLGDVWRYPTKSFMSARIDKYVAKFVRGLERGIAFESCLVNSFVRNIAFDITHNGDCGQVQDLLSVVPTLDDSLRATLAKYVLKPDNSIFCLWVLADSDHPDWRHPPTQMRANIDDSTDPVTILVECDDGTSVEVPPYDPVRNVVFALRDYFAEHSNSG
jgi:hypothetical protein